jgi:superfamily I DNA/RNA helicase
MYKDIKMILTLVTEPFNFNITRALLWKLCRYMSVANASHIAKFQDEAGLSLKDTIGYLLKYLDKDDSISLGLDSNGNERKIKVHQQIEENMKYRWRSLTFDTKTYLTSLYRILSTDDPAKIIGGMMSQYRECAGALLYKREDKQRSITGLCNYIVTLIDKMGYDKTMEFLRLTEQYEQGNMAISGQKVTLTTIHSAKGKEWKNVIAFAVDNVTMPGMEDIKSMIGEGNTIHEINEYIDEERRLYYVEMTRAKQNLLLITYKQPSIFVMESLGAIKKTTMSTNSMLIDMCSSDSYVAKQQLENVYDTDILNEKVIDVKGEFHYSLEDNMKTDVKSE